MRDVMVTHRDGAEAVLLVAYKTMLRRSLGGEDGWRHVRSGAACPSASRRWN